MTCHFTYSEVVDKENNDLRQGDLLRKTEALVDLFKKIHPYFLKEDYKYFLILTQSCDLVRRVNGECRARYITLAAVRPLEVALQRQASSYQKDNIQKNCGICLQTSRHQMYQEVERILNNNHPEYFYLHEDANLGLSERYCAFLRVSIAIRARDHYEKCLEAKFLELSEAFRAKLGWLLGNLYSRVGTDDWVPKYMARKDFKKYINTILDNNFMWLEPKVYKRVKEKLKPLSEEEITFEIIKREAEKIKLPTQKEIKEKVVQAIIEVLEGSAMLLPNADLERLRRRIENHPILSAHIR